jgi:ABC-type sulfate transport system permease subunit
MASSFLPYSLLLQSNEEAAGLLAGGVGCVFMIIYIAVIVLFIASLWKIFTKANQPGWAAIIPIYNIYVLTQIVGRPAWWIVLFIIPCVNIVVGIMLALDLAKSFGKDIGFAVGMILLPFIFYPVLAFGKATYVGPAVKPS